MRQPRLRFQVIAFTALRTVVNTAFRMVYPLLPAFRDGLGVDLAAMTRAITWRSIAGAFGPLLAGVADNRGRKAGMLLGLTLFAGGAGVVVFWPTFGGLALALMLTALGKYTFDPAMQAYLSDRVPYERRGLTLGLTELGWSGSFLLGVPLVGFLIARAGWLAPFPLLALLGLLFLALFAWWLPRDLPADSERSSLLHNLGAIFRAPSGLAGLSVTLLICAANELVNLVFGVWIEAEFGLQITALGAAAAVIGLAEFGGEGLVSTLVDRIGKKRAVALGLLCNNLFALGLPLLGGSLPAALTGLFLFYLSFEFTIVSSIPMMTEILPRARATLMAANSAAASVGRALAAAVAASLFGNGFFANVLGAVLINLLALAALSRVAITGETGTTMK